MNDCKVRQLMTRAVVTVAPEDSVPEAARRLAGNHISAAPVIDRDVVVGIISESDILRVLAPSAVLDKRPSILDFLRMADAPRADGAHRDTAVTVREAMTRDVACIAPDASVWEAAALMQRRRIKRLPVSGEDRRLVGIISREDLIRAMARNEESIVADVEHALETLGARSRDVDVSVVDGVVTLTGEAPDGETIRLAVALAERVAGVTGVRDLVAQAGHELRVTELSKPA